MVNFDPRLHGRLSWITLTLFLYPSGVLTLCLGRHHQSSKALQGMFRRHNGANPTVFRSAGQNVNGKAWNEPVPLSLSSDDLTATSSSLSDAQDSLSPLEFDSSTGKSSRTATIQRSMSFAALDRPSLQTGRMLVLLAACIYGTNFSLVKLLDDTMPLSVSATLRFGLAASVVSAIVLSKESDDVEPVVHKERNLAFWAGAEIGLWYCIGYIAQAEGLLTVAAGKSAFFNALAVVVVPILDVLFKSKILKKMEVASILIACLGVGLLELGPEGGLTISSGDVLAFMQTIFFGIGYWRLESESQTHNRQAARLTIGQLAAIAVGSSIYAFTELGFGHLGITSSEQIIGWFGDPFVICSLIWAGLVSTALALYLETVALKVVSATELTLLMTTTSLWGAAFAFVSLGEVLTPTGMLGGLLILGGCVLGNVEPVEASTKVLDTIDETSSMVLPMGNRTDSFLIDLESYPPSLH